jgi:hypothetical protein
VIKTLFHYDNVNREEGFTLSTSRKPPIQILNERKKVLLSRDK